VAPDGTESFADWYDIEVGVTDLVPELLQFLMHRAALLRAPYQNLGPPIPLLQVADGPLPSVAMGPAPFLFMPI